MDGGGATDDEVLEPEELPLFQDKPAAAPGVDVVAKLGKPTRHRLAADGRLLDLHLTMGFQLPKSRKLKKISI